MITYLALLRAINVGGTGKLPMADLKRMCIEAGFDVIGTYIQSGNVILRSSDTADVAKSKLERRLQEEAGRTIQGQSKLVIPAAAAGTARNMNTVAKLVEMSSKAPDHTR